MNFRLFIKLFTSFAVGAFFIIWLYQSIDISKLFSMSQSLDFRYIGLAIAFYALALSTKIFRWKKLLNQGLSFKQIGKVLIVGYAMNVILPARLGEFFRANLCKIWYSISRSTAFATIVLERVADGITVLFCLTIGLLALKNLHYRSEMVLMLTGGSILFGAAFLILLLLKKFRIESFLQKSPVIQEKIINFQSGIRNLSKRAIWQIIPLSLLIWFFEGLSLWAIVKAVGCHLDFFGSALLIGVVSLSTLVPSPPGFLGTMQFAFAIALKSVGCSTESGVLAATLSQIFLIGLLTVFGVVLYTWISLRKKKHATQTNPMVLPPV